MFRFIKQHYITVLIVAVIVLAVLAAAFAGKKEGKTNFVADAAGIVLTPLQGSFHWVFDNISGIFQYIGDIRTNAQDNEALTHRVQELESELVEFEDLRMENDRLRSLLDLKERQREYDTVGAEIIAKEPGNWFTNFTIDKGTMDGLSQSDPVINTSGLVGYIYDIGTTWAKVSTIVAPTSSTGAVLPRTGEEVVVDGIQDQKSSILCKMSYVPKDSNIMVGDTIETSGLGGMYPKGLYIGRVKEIQNSQDGLTRDVLVEPAVDFKRLREVLVIRSGGAGSEGR